MSSCKDGNRNKYILTLRNGCSEYLLLDYRTPRSVESKSEEDNNRSIFNDCHGNSR